MDSFIFYQYIKALSWSKIFWLLYLLWTNSGILKLVFSSPEDDTENRNTSNWIYID